MSIVNIFYPYILYIILIYSLSFVDNFYVKSVYTIMLFSYFTDYIAGYMNAGILHCIAQTVVDWWFTTNPPQSSIYQQFLF